MNYEIAIWNLVKDVTERVYLGAAPHNPTLPYLLVQLVNCTHDHVLSDGPMGHVRATIQFDAIGRDQDEVISMISDVRALLDGYSGGSVAWSAILDEQDETLPPNDDSPSFLYRRVARYLIRLQESE